MCSVLSYVSTNNTKAIDTTSATLSDSQIAATNSAQLVATNDAVSTAAAPVPTATTDTSIPTDTPVPTQAPPQLQHWTFTGNGTQKTAQFTTNSGTWKISWKCDPAAYGFEYNLIVEIDDSSSNYVDGPVNVICKTGVTSGSSMEYNLQGTYYLNVNSEGPWTIKIQEQ
jgi:hypothetical protein